VEPEGQSVSVAELLQKVHFLSGLSSADVQRLVEIGHTRRLNDQQVVFLQGDPADGMYIIVHGSVRVYQTDEAGNDRELNRLSAGDYFGEIAIVDRAPRSASVATTDECEFFVLGRDDFFTLLIKSPRLLDDVLVGLTEKMRKSSEKLFQAILEEERARAAAEIERHRSIAQMVAGVAHEINTPLGIINQAASLLTESLRESDIENIAKDEDAKEMLVDFVDAANLIQSNVQRARVLVESFKKLSVRQVTDQRETVDIAETLTETTGLYRLQARASGLEIVVDDRLGEGDRSWDGYPGYLSQIVLNLLTNIDRYAYPEGKGGKVDVTLSRTDEGYEISVADHGAGMAPEHVKDVFTPFFTTGRSKGGTGLGMSIVYNLVTSALGGAIDVDSTLGEGTRVTMRFPRVAKSEVVHAAVNESKGS